MATVMKMMKETTEKINGSQENTDSPVIKELARELNCSGAGEKVSDSGEI